MTAAPSVWALSGGGSWSDPNSWANTVVPTNAGDTADFDTSIGDTNPAVVTMDGARGLMHLVFNTAGTGSYTITGTDTLTMDNGSAAATMVVMGGSHTIAVPVALASDVAITLAGGTKLAISGPISENAPGGMALTTAGGGVLALSASNTYTGRTTISSGTLEIDDGGSINSSSGVVDNGVLAFSISGATTFAPPISGSGGLAQRAAAW